ncbi:hypothetical protein [Lentzea aerocolonigenes]|uniref:hypothetical protein n=1 Tax=Lentzea aerocolonigenes TaxID=68170 RepID=UPI000AD7FB20|nr:hypothetical protein [Lentzea aerocolonigenes]MCP2244645.1 hypothetical protein [Lentzea aerocolonigenes]
MNLKFLGTTSNSGSCPNLYRTDRDTYVVQGYKVTDPDALAAARDRNMLDTETLVEIPVALLGFAPTTINSDSYPHVYETGRNTYVMQGNKVTDPDALATAHERGLPDTETLIEITIASLDLAPMGA